MGTGIHNRKLTLCPRTANWPVPALVEESPECNHFLLFCCACSNMPMDGPDMSQPCHHYRIVFTDGACSQNGRPEAKAGVGVALGSVDNAQWSIPITDKNDNFPIRTSQRAELHAAGSGLEFLAWLAKSNGVDLSSKNAEPNTWIIATDSAYVVKGMTEWLPTWRKKNWRTSNGTEPANLDLFLALDAKVQKYEEVNVKVAFWHIPREDNKLADSLAKSAAVNGDIGSKWAANPSSRSAPIESRLKNLNL